MATLPHDSHAEARERILADGMRDVAAELRLVDVLDLIAYSRAEQHAVLNDLVSSSVELFFKDGTLRYGWSTDVELDWQGAPAITLEMEFQHRNVTVFFRLALHALNAAIDIHHIMFDCPRGDADRETELLADAVSDARIPKTARISRAERFRPSWLMDPPASAASNAAHGGH